MALQKFLARVARVIVVREQWAYSLIKALLTGIFFLYLAHPAFQALPLIFAALMVKSQYIPYLITDGDVSVTKIATDSAIRIIMYIATMYNTGPQY